jgi:tetratricopeptide (TPR) repeat protein
VHAERARRAAAERAEGERLAKQDAQKRLAQIERGTEILASVFQDLDPKAEEKEGVNLRVLLGRRLGEAVRQLDGEAVGDPLIVARLQHELGISLRELGHLDQAEATLDRASKTRERLLGAAHLDTAATKQNLAQLYRARGKFAQAEALYSDVLAIRTGSLGPDHDDTLTTKNNLALVYMSQGKFGQAEPLLRDVLAVRIVRLGPDDLKTLQSKHNLAGACDNLGKLAEAEALLKEVLAGRTEKLKPGHPDTLQTKNNLGHLYVQQRKYAQAETLVREVVETSAAELGPGHNLTLMSRQNLAAIYQRQAKFDLAEQVFKDVLAAQLANPATGPRHPETLQTKTNLAGIYDHEEKFDQAIVLYEEALEPSKTILGAGHPLTLTIKTNLGIDYSKVGRSNESLALLEEVYKGRRSADTRDVHRALVLAYLRAGKRAEATALLADQVRSARQQFAANSPQLAAALTTAGRGFLDAEYYVDAESLLREVLAIREKLAPDDWETHNTKSLIGDAMLGQRKYADAEPLLLKGYEGLQQTEAQIKPIDRSVWLGDALERLVKLYNALGKPDEAARWRKAHEALRPATRPAEQKTP